ncbi:MAG: hypothetical protein HZB11_01950 [Candidatus Yonathbacteria bacterium]|nr:hypothetical protein [Candidatus Yonathbacteria bacterium]
MKNNKIVIGVPVLLSILFSIFYFLPSALAFEATSTTFELHAGDTESTVASSTSATFRLHNAGGQNATASSSLTTKSISSGILYWLYGFFTPSYEQTHYRWRNDDGTNETDATFPVNEDTLYNQFPKNTVKRLRIEISNEGWTRAGTAPQLRLEVASTTTCASGTYAPVLTDYSGQWHLATSTIILTDPVATSNVSGGLTDSNIDFVAGQVKTTGNTTSAITLTSHDFTEVEFGVMASSSANDGGTYCFRLTNNGSTTTMAYTESKYAKAVIGSGLSATGELYSAVFDTTATSTQGPAYNSIMWNGTEGVSTGKIRFQFATSNSSSGPWTFYGSADNGATCNTSDWYDTLTSGAGGGPGKPVEIWCSPSQHNNQRYFRYRIQICSANCSSSGTASPVVSGVVVNWAP